jgi:hypothetical protein
LKIAGVSGIYSQRYFGKPRNYDKLDYFYRDSDIDKLIRV